MTRPRPSLLCPLVFLSGVSGLGYQMVWSRQFGMGLGTEMASVLAVICAFLGGMALGSWAFDRTLCRSSQPGKWYACLELVIGFWALLSSLFIPSLQELALKWIGSEPSALRHWLIAFFVPLVALLPATAAMGATLPAMDRWLAPLVPDQRAIGLIYAVNTFGAVIGTLLSVFVLMPAVGLKTSLWIFAALNVLCGLVAAGLQKPVVLPEEQAKEPAANGRTSLTLWATGFLGIGYEAVGIRALSQILENTIYTFAFVLAVYLLGTAIGGALYHRLFKARPFVPVLNHLLVWLSSVCLLGGLVLSKAQVIYDQFRQPPAESLVGQVFLAVLVFGLPTLLMGALFSHLVQHARRSQGVGQAAAWNVLGGALSPMFFGIVLLPLIGIRWTLLVVGLGYVLLLSRIREVRWALVGPALLAAALWISPFQLVQIPPGTRVAVYKEGRMASVAVLEDDTGHRTLRVNNRFQMGGTGAASAEYRHAHIPLLLHSNPRQALVLGLGTGISLGGTSFHPELRTDGVELLPEVIEVMPQFEPFNFGPTRNPAMRVYAADARRFVRAATNRYDVIVSDLFHPAMDGAGALYTVEHFRAIRQRLNPEGLFCQWLPLHQLDSDMLRVITATFLEAFPDAQGYLLRLNVDAPVLGLIGFITPPRFSPDWIEKRVRSGELEAQLKSQSLGDSVRFFGSLLAGPKELRAFAGNAFLNTDDFPRVIFGAPKLAYATNNSSYGRLLMLLEALAPEPAPILGLGDSVEATGFAERLKSYFAARAVYLRGLVEHIEGRADEALNLFVESARLSPDFTPGYAHTLSVASLLAKTKPAEARALLERLAAAQPSRPVAREMLRRLFGN